MARAEVKVTLRDVSEVAALIDRLTERAETAIERVRAVLDDLDASHRRAVSDRAITDDYARGRVHAEDDLWRRLGAALDERDADA